VIEERVSLNDARLAAVCAEIEAAGARSVIDLGCGEGRLLSRLSRAKQLARIAGTDVSPRALEIARDRLRIDELPERDRERIALFQASLTYRDARFAGFDAACAVEVIEHIEPSRLGGFERVVFEFARPVTVIVTTPNAEYNARFESLPAGKMRHRDHRFEWTRAEFEGWARGAAERHGYAVRFVPIGEVDAALGAPTQMGVFSR
jgi:3' terminal RNA ribose 2'-O-methyltransferase Hen1